MSEDAKLIDVKLYGGTSTSKAEARLLYCGHTDKCPLYKEGKCLNATRLIGSYCSHSDVRDIKGYTTKGMKYNSFVNEYKSMSEYHKIEQANDYFVDLNDDYYYIQTFYVKYDEEQHRIAPTTGLFFVSNKYLRIPKHQLTVEILKDIFTIIPRGFNNKVIESYQQQAVPRIQHEMEYKKFEPWLEFKKTYPELVKTFSYVGKMAYLNTLKSNIYVKDKSGRTWFYNGNTLKLVEGKDKVFYNICLDIKKKEFVNMEFEYIPDEDATVEITDEDWVTSNTKVVN